MDWVQVFVNLILTGILLYVFQKSIDERSEKRLEKFKAELRATAFEQETKFSKLHEKRIEILAELYAKLSSTRKHVNTARLYAEYKASGFIADGKTISDLINKLSESVDVFACFYAGSRLYLPNHLCEQIDLYHEYSVNTYFNLTLDYAENVNGDNFNFSQALHRKLDVLGEKVDVLSKAIENEFRVLIGSM